MTDIELKPPIVRLAPLSAAAHWLQIDRLFQRHGLAPPPYRLRDELVVMFDWAHYGQQLSDASALAPSTSAQVEGEPGLLAKLKELHEKAVAAFCDAPCGSSQESYSSGQMTAYQIAYTAVKASPAPVGGAAGWKPARVALAAGEEKTPDAAAPGVPPV